MYKMEEKLYPIHVYKEPLRTNAGGYGYLGAVLQTADGSKIQCHICGKLFRSLASHLTAAHKVSAKEYRKSYGIAHNTALVSDQERVVRADRFNEMVASGKITRGTQKDNWEKASKASVKACKGKKFELSLEVKNKRGSCPDQIIDKIQQFHKEFGFPPTRYQFEDAYKWGKRYVRLAENEFGSFRKAVIKACGKAQEYKQPYPKKQGKDWSSEEIIEMIQLYYQEENRVPTFSDFRRGYFPHPSTIARRFGSLVKAREIALANMM